jgi:hypothetical protein
MKTAGIPAQHPQKQISSLPLCPIPHPPPRHLITCPVVQIDPYTPPMPTASTLDQPLPSVDQYPMVVEITIYVAQDDGLHNDATPVTAVHQYYAIHSQSVDVPWVMFWLIPWVV